MGTHPIFESDFDCLTAMRFTRLHSTRHLTEPSTWRPLTVREICLFPRFPRAVPYNMSFYGVNAAELITQKPNMLSVVKVESLLQPWRKRSSHHRVLSFSKLLILKQIKKLWRMLYAQSSQESNNKTEFSTKVVHNSTDEPFTRLEFEDGQVMTFKTDKLEFDYMAYIIIRELAEREMIAASVEDIKV